MALGRLQQWFLYLARLSMNESEARNGIIVVNKLKPFFIKFLFYFVSQLEGTV